MKKRELKKKDLKIEVKLTWPGIKGSYKHLFQVDEESSISIVPKSELIKAGFKPEGTLLVKNDGGSFQHWEYCLAVFEIDGKMMHGRVVMGPENSTPVLGWWVLKDFRNQRRRV